MQLTRKLLKRNQDLELERMLMIDQIKKEVQLSGHLVLEKFKSFGGGTPTNQN